MIAMQYSIVLPRDYDMQIIDRRIQERGHLTDGFPHLRFKAYLSAQTDDETSRSTENLYAPFYLWDNPDGLNAFLTGPGFATLARDFGRPAVQTWIVWDAVFQGDLRDARFASRDVTAIPSYADLAANRDKATTDAKTSLRDGALAAVAAFNPTSWTMVKFRLLPSLPDRHPRSRLDSQLYHVGHVSLP